MSGRPGTPEHQSRRQRLSAKLASRRSTSIRSRLPVDRDRTPKEAAPRQIPGRLDLSGANEQPLDRFEVDVEVAR